MTRILLPFALVSLLFSAAIFGFFYAWVCSTMWGLDAADPRVAIAAMQAMNASVRNAVFAPAFFGTPVLLAVTAALACLTGQRSAAAWFGAGAVIYGVLGAGLTMAINVPMNEALAQVRVPESRDEAGMIWQAYSGRWQDWNQVRTVTSGLAVLCAGMGIRALAVRTGPKPAARLYAA